MGIKEKVQNLGMKQIAKDGSRMLKYLNSMEQGLQAVSEGFDKFVLYLKGMDEEHHARFDKIDRELKALRKEIKK